MGCGQILKLSTCSYREEARNTFILSSTGSGKTFLAEAFGMAAWRKEKKVHELLVELAIARDGNHYHKTIKEYTKVDLLIIDEWMFSSLNRIEATDLLEVIEARYKKDQLFSVRRYYRKVGETNWEMPTLQKFFLIGLSIINIPSR